MKIRLLLICFCMFLGIFVMAQDTLTFYCNEDGYKTTKDNAAFLRKTYLVDGLWNVYDYNLTGELKTIGAYNGKNEKQGHFINYHLNEKKLSEGNYKDNEKEGKWNTWYENGALESTANYLYGYYTGTYKSWYENGIIQEESLYIDDINIIQSFLKKSQYRFDKSGKVIPLDGVLLGTNKFYYSNGQMSSKEEWKNDTLIGLEIWDANGNPEKLTLNKNNHFVNRVSPEFKGGQKELTNFFDKNLKYPVLSNFHKETGTPVICFYIEKDGTMSDVKVSSHSVYPRLDEEALRVVKLLNGNWIPGKVHNQVVRSYYEIPVEFNLKYRYGIR